jgi:tight adherence protein B
MVRRTLVVAALVLTAASPAAAGVENLIREIKATPDGIVTMTVSARSDDGSPPVVQVTENGRAVPLEAVRPLASSERALQVVLAIDVSNSMRGEPLEQAFAAARNFVETSPLWVEIGLLTFADQPTVVSDLSSDHQAILGQLASPPETVRGTALFHAVEEASAMFSGTGQRNIVLLTDGRNTRASGTLQEATRQALSAKATVFSVGLEGADTDTETLEELSTSTSGAHIAVAASGLRNVYATLAENLSRQYTITYRSDAPPGSRITVAVEVNADRDEVTIRLPIPPAFPVGGKSLLSGLLQSPWALPVLLLAWYVATFLVFSTLFGGRARARRDRELAARLLARPAREKEEEGESEQRRATLMPDAVANVGEQIARATGLNTTLDRYLERAALPVRTGEFVMAIIGSTTVAALVGGFLFRNIIFGIVFAVAGGLGPFVAVSIAASKRADRLRNQLPDVLMVLASSLRAGHSFLQGLDMVAKEVGDPAAQEFTRTVTEIRLGRPVDEALEAMAERVGNDDFDWAVLAINIQRQVGGNLAEVLETVAETIRERGVLRRQVKVLSAEGRLSVAILVALPPLLATYISFVNPAYIDTLFGTRPGLMLVGGAGILMIFGFLWMRKVVKLNV